MRASLLYGIVAATLAGLMVGNAQPRTLQPVRSEPIVLHATPIVLAPSDPLRTRVGRLTLIGGWRLTSSSRQFGGLSALSVVAERDGWRVIAVSDAAAIVSFRLTRFGRAVEAQIDPVPPACGITSDQRSRDTESLAGDAKSGWWIGFEWRNAICRVTGDFAHATGLATPPAMARWSRTRGPEAMVRLRDGRFVVLQEGHPGWHKPTPALMFPADPIATARRAKRFSYLPPYGNAVTDAAELPDGRLITVNRRFSLPELFTSVIAIADTRDVGRFSVVPARPIARFASPTVSDNFEGVAVTQESGRTIIWLISDDNFMDFQSTYLLKLALDPDA